MDHEALLRDALEAYMRRDVEGVMAFLTDDVEIVPALSAIIEGRTYKGREGVVAFFAARDEMWSDFSLDLGEIEADGDRILTLGRLRATAVESGLAFDEEIASITVLRDGKIARWETFVGHERALTLFRERA